MRRFHDWLARLFDLIGRAVDRLSAVAGYWGGIVLSKFIGRREP